MSVNGKEVQEGSITRISIVETDPTKTKHMLFIQNFYNQGQRMRMLKRMLNTLLSQILSPVPSK